MKFAEVVNEAIDDLLEHGFDSKARLDRWLQEIAAAAKRSLVPQTKLKATVRDVLERTFRSATSSAALFKAHRGVSQFTLKNVKPRLRAELDRRIVASSDLITLNREASITRTLQRFAGWATSIPAGGSEVGKRKDAKKRVRRAIAALPYEERRVVIDQGHKLVAAISDIIATDGGAIAARWHHVKEGPPAYDARPDHVKRDGKVYLIRGGWANKEGFVKGPYSDEITQPGEEVFCRCWFEYLYALRDLPDAMLTSKGKQALFAAREQLKLLRA